MSKLVYSSLVINGKAIGFIPKFSENSEANTKLICEAFNVIARTGLTPEQMEVQLDGLKEQHQADILLAKQAVEEIYELKARLNETVEFINEFSEWKNEYSSTRLKMWARDILTKVKAK